MSDATATADDGELFIDWVGIWNFVSCEFCHRLTNLISLVTGTYYCDTNKSRGGTNIESC